MSARRRYALLSRKYREANSERTPQQTLMLAEPRFDAAQALAELGLRLAAGVERCVRTPQSDHRQLVAQVLGDFFDSAFRQGVELFEKPIKHKP